jgi:HAD superfamily hydrolase (TIGR01490 family)
MTPPDGPPGPVPGAAAVFDFDGTVLRTDTTVALLAFVVRRFPRALADLLGLGIRVPPVALGLLSRDRLKELAVATLRHVPPADREGFFREFHDRVVAPRFLARALQRIAWHREQGHELVLASASIELYLRHAAAALGFPHLVCTRATLDPRPRLVGANCRGGEKVRRLRELDIFPRVDWSVSWCYSDSLSDLPLFRLCGHPVAVNPGRTLRTFARRTAWEIQDW